jgi:hypothetical protein
VDIRKEILYPQIQGVTYSSLALALVASSTTQKASWLSWDSQRRGFNGPDHDDPMEGDASQPKATGTALRQERWELEPPAKKEEKGTKKDKPYPTLIRREVASSQLEINRAHSRGK